MSSLDAKSLDKNFNLFTLQNNPSEEAGFAVPYSNKDEGWRTHITYLRTPSNWQKLEHVPRCYYSESHTSYSVAMVVNSETIWTGKKIHF